MRHLVEPTPSQTRSQPKKMPRAYYLCRYSLTSATSRSMEDVEREVNKEGDCDQEGTTSAFNYLRRMSVDCDLPWEFIQRNELWVVGKMKRVNCKCWLGGNGYVRLPIQGRPCWVNCIVFHTGRNRGERMVTANTGSVRWWEWATNSRRVLRVRISNT